MTFDSRTCLYPGRFQPFHQGHALVVKTLAARYCRLIITISQAHLSHTQKDPFTGGERYEMLKSFLIAEDLINRVDIIPIPTDSFPTTWVPFIRSVVPPFQVVYARNPLIQTIFSFWNYELDKQELPRPTSGTEIRKAIETDTNWKMSVPLSVVNYIEQINGEERIKKLALGANF